MNHLTAQLSTIRCTITINGINSYEEFQRTTKEIGFNINERNTKYIKTTRNLGAKEDTIIILDYEFSTYSSFKFLGAIMADINEEIKERLVSGSPSKVL